MEYMEIRCFSLKNYCFCKVVYNQYVMKILQESTGYPYSIILKKLYQEIYSSYLDFYNSKNIIKFCI